MSGQLLAVVGVERDDRVVCQAAGCGHGVYRRIHVVRHDDGTVGVYGSDCFARLFADVIDRTPRYGGGDGRELTAEERLLLAENTERLIAMFEAEEQVAREQERVRLEEQEELDRASLERAQRIRTDAERQRLLTDAEIASVEREAKAAVRRIYGVDADAPGWRGLVIAEARKLLGR